MPNNPFYVEPGNNFGPGLMGLSDLISKEKEKRKKEEEVKLEKEKLATMQADVSGAMQSNDPNKIRSVMGKYPMIADKIKAAVETKFPNQSRDAFKTSLFNAAVDFKTAPDALAEMRKAFEVDGIDPQEQAKLDSFEKLLSENPEDAKSKLLSEFAMTADEDTWKKYQDITKEKKSAKTAMESFLQKNPDADEDQITAFASKLSKAEKQEGSPKTEMEAFLKTDPSPAEILDYSRKLANAKKTLTPKDAAFDRLSREEQRDILMKEGKKTVERPYMADLMAQGYIPSGRITAPMLDAFEAAARVSAERGKPLTVDDLYDMEFTTAKNVSTGRAAGSRLSVARKQNIESAYGLLDDMEKSNAKLNLSPVQFAGKLEMWKNKQLNDPVFTEYMTQRADSLFVLGNALKQNGLTDKSIEVEEEAFNPTLSPQAFQAWIKTQRRALDRAAEEMNKDYKTDIKPSTERIGSINQKPTTEPKKVTQKFISPSTGKVKLIYDDGTEEIRNND